MKRVLKGLGALLLLFVALLVGVFSYNAWLLHTRSVAAREAASAMCASLPPGSEIAPALARAQGLGIQVVEQPAAGAYIFEFMVFLDGWGCRTQIADGRVTVAEVIGVN